MIDFVELEDEEHKKLLKAINGALRSTIKAHGPITNVWIGSAGKRIMGALKSHQKNKSATEETPQV